MYPTQTQWIFVALSKRLDGGSADASDATNESDPGHTWMRRNSFKVTSMRS